MKSKICNTCNIKRSVDDFHKDKKAKDGHKNKCKSCVNSSFRKYYENKKKIETNPISECTIRQKLVLASARLAEHVQEDKFDDILSSLEEIKKLTLQRKVEKNASALNSIQLTNIHIPSGLKNDPGVHLNVLRSKFVLGYMDATGEIINDSDVSILTRTSHGDISYLIVYDKAELTPEQKESIAQEFIHNT